MTVRKQRPRARSRSTGLTIRDRVHGPFPSSSTGQVEAFCAFDTYLLEAGWAGIWGRPDLSFKIRSLLTIALLVAQNDHDELGRHIKSALLRTGCSMDEIAETIFHAGLYCGVPSALSARRIAEAIFAEVSDDSAQEN